VRPRRIARRFLARAKHWGTPHVHCPGCGGDRPVPADETLQTCFVCELQWRKVALTGDEAVDSAAVRAAGGEGRWAATWHPLMVDVPEGTGKGTATLDCAFVYYP